MFYSIVILLLLNLAPAVAQADESLGESQDWTRVYLDQDIFWQEAACVGVTEASNTPTGAQITAELFFPEIVENTKPSIGQPWLQFTFQGINPAYRATLEIENYRDFPLVAATGPQSTPGMVVLRPEHQDFARVLQGVIRHLNMHVLIERADGSTEMYSFSLRGSTAAYRALARRCEFYAIY